MKSDFLPIAFFVTVVVVTTSRVPASAQDIDGLVQQPELLVGQDATIQPVKGAAIEGKLNELVPSRKGLEDLQFLEVEKSGKTRKIRVDQVASLTIGGKEMLLRPNPLTKSFNLIDVAVANAAIDSRLQKLGKSRRIPISENEFDSMTKKNLAFANKSVEKLGGSLYVMEGSEAILITDYPQQQSKAIARAIDQMFPSLNTLFGVGKDIHVLPGKPVVGAFGRRENLAKFQSEIVKHDSYGTIRAFFQMVDEHVVISAEDDRSTQHMIWQAAWGLSGAYSTFCYTNAELPRWMQVGLQQHCSDVLVKGFTDHAYELKEVATELKGGSLNGILNAENLPGQRQLVCKLITAHLYQTNAVAFGQMLQMLKQGRTTDEVLKLCYGINQQSLASSFGKTISIPGLTP